MLITAIPKSVAVGTPTDSNRWLASEANQVIDELQNVLDDTGQTKSSSDLYQLSKGIARYVFGNTLAEDSGSSTHSGSADSYVVLRDGGDSKKIPATLLRGIIPIKIVNANQSNDVALQIGTTASKDWKKFDMAGNLTEIAVGELRANDIVYAQYDTDVGVYILKKVLSDDEVKNIVGKFNILNFLDFTTSAPTSGGTIGDRYINTTSGTISAGNVGASGTTVTLDKIYELYDITAGYNWREIDPQDGDFVFNDNDKNNYIRTSSSWNRNYFNANKYSISGFVPVSGTTSDEQVTVSTGICLCEDGSTTLELTSTATDIDFPTLNGGALSVSTTYHLFAYKKNDNTLGWHLDTTLSPTISSIKSVGAYRRIDSNKTDSSGDLLKFYSVQRGHSIIKRLDLVVNEYNSAPTTTRTTTTFSSIPVGFKVLVKLGVAIVSTGTVQGEYRICDPDTQDVATTAINSTFANGEAGDSSDGGSQHEVLSNTSGQLAHRANSATGNLYLNCIGYEDFRNYF